MTGFQFPSHVTIYAGDEGQALGGSYMAFHFQSDLSPCLKNAGASRFLITTIPSSYYASRWNIWVQSFLWSCCKRLDECFLKLGKLRSLLEKSIWHCNLLQKSFVDRWTSCHAMVWQSLVMYRHPGFKILYIYTLFVWPAHQCLRSIALWIFKYFSLLHSWQHWYDTSGPCCETSILRDEL